MVKNKVLFIDETGKHNLSHWSWFFILSGCLIFEDHVSEFREMADSIIFKYWGSHRSYSRKYKVNEIVFRADDIRKCKGPFVILKDPALKKKFWKDIHSQLLSRPDIIYLFVLVDKKTLKSVSPRIKDKTILDKAYNKLMESFISYLHKSGYHGKIVAESSAEQDVALVNALSHFQRNSGVIYKDSQLVNNMITSLSLVNKHDNNIGAQMADLIAWTGSNKYQVDHGTKKLSDLRFEEKILLNMFNKKTKRIRSKLNSQYIVIP